MRSLLFALVSSVLTMAANAESKLTMGENGLELKVSGYTAVVKAENWNGQAGSTDFVARWSAGSYQLEYRSADKSFWENNQQVSQNNQAFEFKQQSYDRIVATAIGGRFATGLTGSIEFEETRDGGKQDKYIVFRTEKGQYYTKMKIQDWITERLEKDEDGSLRFTVRWSKGNPWGGRFVDGVKVDVSDKGARYCNLSVSDCPVIAIRQTGEDKGNGAFLSALYGSLDNNNRCSYRAASFKGELDKELAENPGQFIGGNIAPCTKDSELSFNQQVQQSIQQAE